MQSHKQVMPPIHRAFPYCHTAEPIDDLEYKLAFNSIRRLLEPTLERRKAEGHAEKVLL